MQRDPPLFKMTELKTLKDLKWRSPLIKDNFSRAITPKELDLKNVSIVGEHVERLQTDGIINSVVSRAYASLGSFVGATRHLAPPDNTQCKWLAMKSHCTDKEFQEITTPFCISEKIPLTVPGLSAKRQLILIERSAEQHQE